MPQMAPTMWMPLFILVTALLYTTKAAIYFTSGKSPLSAPQGVSLINSSWLW